MNNKKQIKLLGRYILADPDICHGRITREAIGESVKLSGEAFLKHAREFILESTAE